MQGALGRRVNGRPFILPLLDPASANEAELRAAMQEVLRLICERANGATFNSGGGFISVLPARTKPLASGFVWRPAEMARFIDAAKAGKGRQFEFAPMTTFPTYRAFMLDAWTLLNATGPLACTKLTAHTFQFKKNELNPLCRPWRGDTVLREFFNLFGGWSPQPRPRPPQP